MSGPFAIGPAYRCHGAPQGGAAECIVVDALGEPAYIALGPDVIAAEDKARRLAALLNARAGEPDFHWPDLAGADNDDARVLPFPVRS